MMFPHESYGIRIKLHMAVMHSRSQSCSALTLGGWYDVFCTNNIQPQITVIGATTPSPRHVMPYTPPPCAGNAAVRGAGGSIMNRKRVIGSTNTPRTSAPIECETT